MKGHLWSWWWHLFWGRNGAWCGKQVGTSHNRALYKCTIRHLITSKVLYLSFSPPQVGCYIKLILSQQTQKERPQWRNGRYQSRSLSASTSCVPMAFFLNPFGVACPLVALPSKAAPNHPLNLWHCVILSVWAQNCHNGTIKSVWSTNA